VYSVYDEHRESHRARGSVQYQDVQKTPTENLVVAFGDWAAPCSIAWAGCPTGATAYPAYMYIDYVRIYQK
jgi:hypothetical protein